MQEETVTITKQKYYELLCAEAELALLESGGVDNWDWYSESLYGDGDDNLDTLTAAIKKEVWG